MTDKISLDLTLRIKPVPKQSFRFTRFGKSYQSKNVVLYTKFIQFETKKQMEILGITRKLNGPVKATISFIYKKEKQDKLISKTTRPDIDNLCKGILDALKGIVYDDDSIISILIAGKYFCDYNCINVNIEEI
jgi:Holliday junction resolvase RusA-like endonuclease